MRVYSSERSLHTGSPGCPHKPFKLVLLEEGEAALFRMKKILSDIMSVYF